jgi:hypothetical protein
MKKLSLLAVIALATLQANAQLTPEITSWIVNTTNAVGYNNIPSNVQTVQYSATQVYVSCTCIPGYSIGPWNSNPNVPANQNFVYKITRNPVQNTSTPTAVGNGHIGVWTNGVSVFNVSDAMSYNNAGIWNRNAYYWEGSGFDNCLGHPQQQGEYHHHVSPTCLYNQADSLNHSPIIGYAFDGFPIYGAYAYTNTNGTGPIKRMTPSYAVSTATTRANGPNVNATYPAGCFIEDYIYTANSGDLDQRNGRYCVTPEYPNGTYAYFVTIDAALQPIFPYTFYGSYYGVVQSGNTGPGGGHITISEATTVYTPTAVNELSNPSIKFELMPNPTQDYVYVYMDANSKNNLTGKLYNSNGQLLQTIEFMQPSIAYSLDMTNYPAGVYLFTLESDDSKMTQKIIKSK